mmetsp:Transcript_33641/g.95134  ORF Transcript_33641/g.95134 Transcript_33641/m.95134 type:complete len:287 (+) Transcript_33641:326-1186(+)
MSHPKCVEPSQHFETCATKYCCPYKNDSAAQQLYPQLQRVAAIHNAVVHRAPRDICRGSEEPHCQQAPHPAEQVHWRRVHHVVHLEMLKQPAGIVLPSPSEQTGDEGKVRLHVDCPGSDGHQSSQDAVKGGEDVGPAGVDYAHKHATNPSGAGTQGGCDCHTGGAEHESIGACTHTVEPIPAEPKGHCSQGCECYGCPPNVEDPVWREPSSPGSNDGRPHQSAGTPRDVHDTRASKVHEAIATDAVPAQPSLTAPHPVDHHGVYEALDHDNENEVAHELAPFCDGT